MVRWNPGKWLNENADNSAGDKSPVLYEKILVTVELAQADDSTTMLRLVQENIPNTPKTNVSLHMGCNMGWSFFMTNLKALLEYGVDLREKDPDRAYLSRAISH